MRKPLFTMLLIASAVSVLAGCASGSQHYTPPGEYQTTNSKTVNRSFDSVWADAIPALGKQFFVINNLDKDSGLVNLSYSGEAEKYVDCGRAVSSVTNARGKRDYSYSAASAYEQFELLTAQGLLVTAQRRISLEGRINLIFEKVGASKTQVTANTKYIVTRVYSGHAITGQYLAPFTDTASFTSGHQGTFPVNDQGGATVCVSNGVLESTVLDLVR